MEKIRSKNNRTLTITEEEKATLKNTIYNINDLKHSYKDNSIINGDLFECLDYIPNNYFNLIIIDPPYNLTKDFHGKRFKSMKSQDYEEYLRSWFIKYVINLPLTEHFICVVIGNVLLLCKKL